MTLYELDSRGDWECIYMQSIPMSIPYFVTNSHSHIIPVVSSQSLRNPNSCWHVVIGIYCASVEEEWNNVSILSVYANISLEPLIQATPFSIRVPMTMDQSSSGSFALPLCTLGPDLQNILRFVIRLS